ncbi:MAG: DUF1275 domain-containing protein [Eubacterium sp.]|nr:DUF1275 domain-containing protein [Eubacterium sp.]
MKKSKQMSDAFLTGAFLAVVGGFLDAYTYICRGAVFANAQTGNIVLMGIKLSEGNFSGAGQYIIPILAFVAGILISETIKEIFRKNSFLHWRQIILAFEIVILVLSAFLPSSRANNLITNTLVSFVCSLQVQSFRTVNGNSIATTMCTGNLRSAAELLFSFFTSKNKESLNRSLQYFGIILFFIIGAAIGAATTSVLGIKAVLFAAFGLLIVFFLLFITKESENKTT